MILISIADDDSGIGDIPAGTCDVLVSLGDLTGATIREAVRLYRPQRVFAVRGNHDRPEDLPRGVVALNGRVETFGGFRFGGFDGSWAYKANGHFLYTQAQMASAVADFPPVDIFLAHNSPAGIHERDQDVHQGFAAFGRYIEEKRPQFFLHGHQHVNAITLLGETTVIGVFGCALLKFSEKYARADHLS